MPKKWFERNCFKVILDGVYLLNINNKNKFKIISLYAEF